MVTDLSLKIALSRSNHNSERSLTGLATGGEILEFALPFKVRPLIICTGGLSVKNEDITEAKVKFMALRSSG